MLGTLIITARIYWNLRTVLKNIFPQENQKLTAAQEGELLNEKTLEVHSQVKQLRKHGLKWPAFKNRPFVV